MDTTTDATSPASQVGMEAPLGRNETDYASLIERLEATHTLDTPRETRTGSIINPDGPEAAAAIRDLEAENARLRSAPIPAVQSGAVAWRFRAPGARHWAYEDTGALSGNIEGIEVQPLYAAPQSEPLPGGVGEAGLAADLTAVASEIFERWDKDMRSGKLLTALSGLLADYDPRVTRIRKALAALSGKEQG